MGARLRSARRSTEISVSSRYLTPGCWLWRCFRAPDGANASRFNPRPRHHPKARKPKGNPQETSEAEEIHRRSKQHQRATRRGSERKPCPSPQEKRRVCCEPCVLYHVLCAVLRRCAKPEGNPLDMQTKPKEMRRESFRKHAQAFRNSSRH